MSEPENKLNSLRKTMRKFSGQLPHSQAESPRTILQYESDIENLQAQVKAFVAQTGQEQPLVDCS